MGVRLADTLIPMGDFEIAKAKDVSIELTDGSTSDVETVLNDFHDSLVDIEKKAGNVYSTEETVCGKWIDGKPIYRKVVTGLGNTYTDWNVILLDANVHVDHVIYCNMVSNTKTGANNGAVSTNVMTLIYADGTVHVKNSASNTDSNKVVYVVEYTKTTD